MPTKMDNEPCATSKRLKAIWAPTQIDASSDSMPCGETDMTKYPPPPSIDTVMRNGWSLSQNASVKVSIDTEPPSEKKGISSLALRLMFSMLKMPIATFGTWNEKPAWIP